MLSNVISRLKGKGGESYDDATHHGWRNPIRDDTGELLQALVIAKQPKWVLEIGTAYGLSGLYIASVLPKGSLMDTIEFDRNVAKEAQTNFLEAGTTVDVHAGDALEVIPTLPGKYDFVFLDANKSGYLPQLLALQNSDKLAKGCLVVADNTIDRETEMQDFLDYIAQFPHALIPTQCGLTVAIL